MSQVNDLHIRLTAEEKQKIDENSIKFGFHTVSEFVRYIAINVKEINIKIK
jgi:hypothetical protein